MKDVINKIRGMSPQKVLIIGDIMLDEYFFGTVNRVSPEAPVPVLKEDHKEWCLGGAANVALNCKQIHMIPYLIGLIGNDDEGARVLKMLESQGISTQGIVVSSQRPTTCKRRMIAKNHQMLRVDHEVNTPLFEQEHEKVLEKIRALISHETVILVSDYAKGLVTQDLVDAVIQIAEQHNAIVLVDPKGTDYMKYAGVSYIKPNGNEYAQLVHELGLNENDSLEKNARQACEILGIQGLFITLGERGIVYVSQHDYFQVAAIKRDVIDLTGAGDTVFSFLALGFAYKFDKELIIKMANQAASIAVSHFKTYAVSLDELVDASYDTTEKIFTDWALLKIELDWLKLGGKRVVLTNGCFDIMHPGHIRTLTEAKKQGNILVVAMNTDASVKRLKGDSRPVNNNDFRATMMAALAVVDFVVFFDQDTPGALIEYIKPDVLVKGGDYKKEEIVGYDTVVSYGGDVVIVDFVDGYSTTKIIKNVTERAAL